MIKTIVDDLLEVKSGAIIHGCNCIGVMGAGVALAVRKKYPHAYSAYVDHCNDSRKLAGVAHALLGTNHYVQLTPELCLINAFTQLVPGVHSRMVNYDAVVTCFEDAQKYLKDRSAVMPQIISFPKIGAGLAGGRWEIISSIIDLVVDDTIEKQLYVLD
jgi:O-acetyl-ADP-ribose deacetylase (regulator of RNase III)